MTFFSSLPTSGVDTEEKNGLHPGAWLVWAVAGGLVAVSTTNPFYLLPLAASAWIVHAVCARPGPGIRSFRIFVMFACGAIVVRTALVAFGPINGGSVIGAALEGLRLGVLLIVFGTFNSVTDPARVLKLAPRRFHEASLAAALALSMAPRMIAAVERVREAQRLRGLDVARWRSLPAVAVPALETGLDNAVLLAESMDARGHGRGRRTRYRFARAGAFSVAVAALSGVCAGVFVAAGLAGRGDLSPALIPLGWPEASPTLAGAALLLAVPALIVGRR
jgi:energy-coupling factor transport system permease protein